MGTLDGFYFAYMTGAEGQGIAMFVFRGGVLVGRDPLGVQFDGTYDAELDGGPVKGRITVTAPPNGQLIQGVSTGPHGIQYEMDFELPADFVVQPFIKLLTPMGPVNLKVKRVRGLD